MRASEVAPPVRRRRAAAAALCLALAGMLSGCGGGTGAASGTLATAQGGTAPGAAAGVAAGSGPSSEGGRPAGAEVAPSAADRGGPVAPDGGSRSGATVGPAGGSTAGSAGGSTAGATAGAGGPTTYGGSTGAPAIPAPEAVPPDRPIGGPLAGLDCRTRVHAAVGQSLFAHEIQGRAQRLVEQEGRLAFAPVRLGSGGGVGDIASGLESFVATDTAGRLHYLEVEILRENTDGPVVSRVATDQVIAGGLVGARAVGASIVGHAYGDPEVFVVDAAGRLLRYTLAAQGHQLTPSAPLVLATGLAGVSALGVDVFDTDGDLAQERAAATRVVLVDGDTVRQLIVGRDGTHDGLRSVIEARPGLSGAGAVARMWCSRPGGPMVDAGALVVFDASGAGRVFAGTYTPAVREPRLAEETVTDAIEGLLAG